jgi:hypothetical protein
MSEFNPSAASQPRPQTELHSRYNPVVEARRYVESLGPLEKISFFVLIEPGLGYLIPELKERSGGKIVVLHIDSNFRDLNNGKDVPSWYPDSGETVQGFLEREIPDTPSDSIKIVEWRPSLMRYGRAYQQALSEAAQFIKRADASYRTTLGFGRRWIKNFFKNLCLVKNVLLYRQTDSSVILTGSGPSLQDALPRIRDMRGQALILASSSSALALQEAGVCPDLLISTDGGFWAQEHLHSCFRIRPEIPLALNLCAALPSQYAGRPFLVMNDGSLWQTLVLNELGIPSCLVPQRGTVTASALELALQLSSGPVYLAGVDLALRDIKTHARPYGFDYLFFGSASRTRPQYSQCFTRSQEIAGGASYKIYAEWFAERLKSWPDRIFAMNAANSVFKQATVFDSKPLTDTCFQARPTPDSPEHFCKRAASALGKALGDPRFSSALSVELSALLFPGKGQAATVELREELDKLAARYGK